MPEGFESSALGWVTKTPQAIAYLITSPWSGHLWCFLITTYSKKKIKGNSYLNSKRGKFVLGLLWQIFVLTIFYFVKYKTVMIDLEKIINIAISSLLFAFFIQFIIVLIITKFARET